MNLTEKTLREIFALSKTFPYSTLWQENDTLYFVVCGITIYYDLTINYWFLNDRKYHYFPEREIKEAIEINKLCGIAYNKTDSLFVICHEKQPV